MNIERMLAIARLSMVFGQVRRVTLHEDGEPESDTTHTVMLAIFSMEVAHECGYDSALAAQFAVIHDLPEVYAGDTNTARGLSEAEAAEKSRRETAAMLRLTDDLDGAITLSILQRYEAQREPEARLVRYLDKVLPKLTHYLNGGSALRALGLTASDVHVKHAQQGEQLASQYPEMADARHLFDAACGLIEEGIKQGVVRVAE